MLGHLVDLLVGLPKHFTTVPVGAISSEVSMLQATDARSVVEGILVQRWCVGCFRFSFAWNGLYQYRSRGSAHVLDFSVVVEA